MDFITISFLLIGAGVVLWVSGRFHDRNERVKELVRMDKDDVAAALRPRLDVDVSAGNSSMGQLLSNVGTRIAAKSQVKTDAEITKALRGRNELIDAAADLHNAPIRIATHTNQQKAGLMRSEDELTALNEGRRKRTAEAEAATRPVVVSEVDRIRAENEALRAETEQLQLRIALEQQKAQLANIYNPPNPPPKPEPKVEPKHESLAEKLSREFRHEQETRLKILREAEEYALQYPAQRERIMHDAKKKIEAALKQRA